MQLFTQTFQNNISNYIPHETITCDDRKPPWIDEKIKKLVLQKNCAFNSYSRNKNNTDLFKNFQSHQAHLKTSIEESNKAIIHAYLINYKMVKQVQSCTGQY